MDEDEEVLGTPTFEILVRDGRALVSGSYFTAPPLYMGSAQWDESVPGRLHVTATDGTHWRADDVPMTGKVNVVMRRRSSSIEPGPDRIVVERIISASAGDIFALLTDPAAHARLDGSGMLVAAIDVDEPIGKVADVFQITMHQESMGDYDMANIVTVYERGRALEWKPVAVGHKPIGHVYGYRLVPVGEGKTAVYSYYDWSEIPDRWRARNLFPRVTADDLQATLAKIEGELVG